MSQDTGGIRYGLLLVTIALVLVGLGILAAIAWLNRA